MAGPGKEMAAPLPPRLGPTNPVFTMDSPMIQKITRIPLREAFKHEAHDFTRWLEENIHVLNDCLDISLSNAEREQHAGGFSVDIVAEDESGAKVIIENPLEKSNHDHLGKLITYLVAMEAKTVAEVVSPTTT